MLIWRLATLHNDFPVCVRAVTHQGPRDVEQRWRSGESTRLPLMWPGFDSRTRRDMWVEFVVGSHSCSERFFPGYSGFPLSSKTNISKFQLDLESEGHRCVSRNRLLIVTLVIQSRFIYLNCGEAVLDIPGKLVALCPFNYISLSVNTIVWHCTKSWIGITRHYVWEPFHLPY